MPSFNSMTNFLDFMMFVGCIAIVVLAIWGTWIGIQILVEAFQKGHMEGMDALMLMLSMSSILLAVMSVSDYWKRCEQVSEKHNATMETIRKGEKELDQKLNRVSKELDAKWEKVE